MIEKKRGVLAVDRCIQGTGIKDAPTDKFSEPYLTPTTP
jgi:hypothetical protein